MRRFALGLLILLGLATPALALSPRALDIGKGEQVWFQEDHTVPMVAVTIALPAGSVYDPKDKDGAAAFAAYMFNEGAGALDSQAFQAEIANRAIQLSLSPDHDWLIISFSALTAQTRDAFRLVGLALAHPRFDADAADRVRAQMIQSLKQDEEDPAAVAANRFYRVTFGDSPYAHPIGGEPQSLARITPADLKAFAETHWVKAGARISVSGDIDAKTATALLKAMFDPLPAAAPPAPPRMVDTGPAGLTIVSMNVPQASAVFGLPGMARADKDYLAGYVANYIVGGGDFSARLTNEVREKRGLTYGIATGLRDYHEGGLLVGEVATRADAMNTTLSVVHQVLADYAAHGPTAQELADAKTYLTGSYPLAFASNVGISAQFNAFQRAGLPIDYVTHRNSYIQALTLDDVRRAAARLFDPKRLTVVVGGSIQGGGGTGHAAPR